jgi:hypothetical protein
LIKQRAALRESTEAQDKLNKLQEKNPTKKVTKQIEEQNQKLKAANNSYAESMAEKLAAEQAYAAATGLTLQ